MDMGQFILRSTGASIIKWIERGVAEGAELVADGRHSVTQRTLTDFP